MLNKTIPSNAEIQITADRIHEILRIYARPADAFSVLNLVYIELIQAAYPPSQISSALKAIDGMSELIKQILREGWN